MSIVVSVPVPLLMYELVSWFAWQSGVLNAIDDLNSESILHWLLSNMGLNNIASLPAIKYQIILAIISWHCFEKTEKYYIQV